MPQFDATIKHIKEGIKGFTVAAAVKNIEGWETTLEKVEAPSPMRQRMPIRSSSQFG